MSLVKANGAGEVSGDFYKGVATQSLRFDDGSSAYLNRTLSTGNRKTWTLSFWFKRCNFSTDQDFLTSTGSGASGLWANMITSGNKLQVYGNNQVLLLTDQVLRDNNAWYNIIFRCDTTQSTASNRLKIYLNGSEITSYGTDNRANLTQDGDFGISSNVDHHIGANQSPGNYLDGYLAEFNFTDGVSNDPTAFGETKNGVWIPIKYTGSYGTNGFRLEFNQTGTGTASASTIGADTSGNTNHFTSNGIVSYDCNTPDSPENNFSTMNPLIRGGYANENLTFSEGNLRIISGNSGYSAGTGSTHGLTMNDKIYAEVKLYSGFLDRFGQSYGVADPQREGSFAASGSGNTGSGINVAMDALGRVWKNGSMQSDQSNPSNGDIIGIAFDGPNSQVKFYKNGSAYSTVTSISSSFYVFHGFTSDQSIQVWNFGQNGTFLGTETSQGNSDENGNGDFYYAPPSGHLALCTTSFLEPTVGPNSTTQAGNHFNTVLYSGNGGTQSITGVGFQPDWVWIKERSSTSSHALYDSSRGALKQLESDNTSAESTASSMLTSFDSDGFSVGSSGAINQSSQTYVSWNWKANGGTTSSDSNGSITSTVQANTTAGFSIVLYTGTGANATVGHGLGVAPRWIIMKRRDSSQNWVVYHEEVGNDKELLLNTADAVTSSNSAYFNNTSPTSTVFSLGSDAYANASSGTYVAYCFAEVEGYSKFGSYTGNGNADGAFIYTGFRPAWVIFKRTDSTNHWLMLDNKRNVNNVAHKFVLANASDAEDTSNDQDTDFTSNGFKVRNSNARNNASGGTYVYAAFAEASFKFANAR